MPDTETVDTSEATTVETETDAPENLYNETTAPYHVTEDAETASVPEPEGEATVEFDPALVQRSERIGLSAKDLEELGGDRVSSILAAVDRHIMNPPKETEMPSQAQPETKTPEAPAGYEPLKIEFEEDVDESVQKGIRTPMETLDKKLGEMHKRFDQFQQEVAAIHFMNDLSMFDRMIDGLGEDWKEHYGEGPTMELDPQSDTFKRRMSAFVGGRRLAADHRRSGLKMSDSQAWKRAHESANIDRLRELERKRLESDLKNRQKSFGERPASGRAQQLSPFDAAVAAMKGQKV